MKLSISYKHVGSEALVEKELKRRIEKLGALLKSYAPDAVHLHGVFSKNVHKQQHSFSLNLSLPTGTLHCTGDGADLETCCRAAFNELESQVKKHKSLLRHDYEWKRKGRRPAKTSVLA